MRPQRRAFRSDPSSWKIDEQWAAAKHDRRVVITLNELQHLSGPDDLLTF